MSSRIDNQPTAETTFPVSGKTGNNNALTHGGTSQKLILPGENQADFEALLRNLQNEYRPETQQDQVFIEQLAIAHWFLWRRQRAYNAIEAGVYESAGQSPELLREFDFRHLTLAERYKIAAERALNRAFRNAESIRKERKSERGCRERHARWQAEQELRERRLKLQQEKSKVSEPPKREREEEAVQSAAPKPLTISRSEDRLPRPAPKETHAGVAAPARASRDNMP